VTHHETNRPPLDRVRFDAVVGQAPPWRVVDIVEEAESTNALAAARAAAGEAGGLVLVAEHRTWVTPARAALTFSLLLRPDVAAARWPWIPLLAGVGVVEALRRVTGLEVTLKWPNDVMVGDKKIGGILSERVETPGGAVAIVGVGINVSTTVEELPIPEASSLHLEGSGVLDRTRILAEILETLGHDYIAWVNAHGDPSTGLRGRYLDFSSTVGRRVRVTLPGDKIVQGTATGIDDEGELEVDTDAGTIVVSVGDVVHLRNVE
jgi:BirA family biotin operon repressor/biotin-[acetyl-CoA-carboxylase] ligase